MRLLRWVIVVLAAVAAGANPAVADDAGLVHPEFLDQYSQTNAFRLGVPARHALSEDGRYVLFLRSGPRTYVHDLWQFDTQTGEEKLLLTADAILQGAEEHLTAAEKARRERERRTQRGIASFSISADGEQILVPLSSNLYVVERATGGVRELTAEGGFPLDPRFSPDGRYVSCVRGNELYVIDVRSGAQTRMTHSATETVSNGLAEFIAQEEIRRSEGYWWSPDARTIACQQTDVDGVEVMQILDPANPQREVHAWPYPRAGQDNARVKLALLRLDGGETVWVEWDRETYPYLVDVVWQENAPLTLVVHNRRQTEALVLAADTVTGKTRLLHRERDAAWVQFEHSVPKWLTDGSGWLWSTERNGGWQLELRSHAGRTRRMLTPTTVRYKKLLAVDDVAGVAWFQGWTEPSELHLFRVPLDGSAPPQQMSSVPGEHDAVFSRDGRTYVDRIGPRDADSKHVVMRGDETLGELAMKNETSPLVPNVEYVTLGPPHGFRAAIIRPHDFDPQKRYPVIAHVYGGPYIQVVRAVRANHLLDQWFAENGFIVVKVDGRGTPGRGRDWERVIKGNLIEVSLGDQVAAIRQVAERYPEVALERVGVYGWSFGGYVSAMAVMRNPELFKVGVAGAPVADWRDYSTYYTERYMGLPDDNPEGYEDASVLTHAGKLRRPLLILHGTADDNVYFLHSIKMADALFQAGKEFEFVPLTDLTHSIRDVRTRTVMYDRIFRFIRENLANEEPLAP